jgi:hypothetical protein
VVQRHVLYLSEINSSQELAWRKSIDVLEDGVDRPRTLLALVSYCDHLYELKKGRLDPEAVAASSQMDSSRNNWQGDRRRDQGLPAGHGRLQRLPPLSRNTRSR